MVFWVLTTASIPALCQRNHYRLDGKVVVDDRATYQYQLDFDEKRGKIKGYSLTWLEDKMPNKALVTGFIDKKNKTITFSEHEEKNILFLKSGGMCYFNGTLAYRQEGDIFLLSGAFTGLNNYGQYCGKGEIILSHNTRGDSLLGVTIKPKHEPIPMPTAPGETASEVEVITSGSGKTLDWKSNTCTLEIWDYGTADGDVVSISLNGQLVLKSFELTNQHKQLQLPLMAGNNTIKIIAENEGKAPPNTARLLLADDRKQYSFTAYNEEGKEAVIVLRR